MLISPAILIYPLPFHFASPVFSLAMVRQSQTSMYPLHSCTLPLPPLPSGPAAGPASPVGLPLPPGCAHHGGAAAPATPVLPPGAWPAAGLPAGAGQVAGRTAWGHWCVDTCMHMHMRMRMSMCVYVYTYLSVVIQTGMFGHSSCVYVFWTSVRHGM